MMREKHPYLTLIGARIRDLRIARGFKQDTFAEEAGVARAYYGGVERGERNVSAINLVRIALALRVEVGELFPKSDELRTTHLDSKRGL